MRKALLFTLVGLALALGSAASAYGSERLTERDPAVSVGPAVSWAAPDVAPCGAATCPTTFVGALDLPVAGSVVSGYVRIRGFALNGNQISQIDVYVDGTDEVNRVTSLGGLKLQVPRPDVMQAFPNYLGTAAANAGFEASFMASSYLNGAHTVYVRITDVTGCCFFLAPRPIQIDNTVNQPPFGGLDYPLPNSAANPSGVLPVVGWALDDTGVDHVDVYVDGLVERQAVTGIPRPDVAAAYPDDMAAVTSGFILNVDSTRLANGVHEVSVKAVDSKGQQGFLGSRQVQIFNNGPGLPPFGEVEMPLENSTWFGNCAAAPGGGGGPSGGGGQISDARYLMRVQGWALDTGMPADRGGVSHVRLEMDGVPLKDSRIDCRREPLLNYALVDCYGYYRPDIELLYPGFSQAPNSGFLFLVDVGYLLSKGGFTEGAHILQVKAADKEETWAPLKDVRIVMECATATSNPPPLAYVEDPTNYELVSGTFPVMGWALDLDYVARVRIKVDGVVQVDAVTGHDYAEYGLWSSDIALIYPYYPQAYEARFRFYLDTTKLSNSEHDLTIEVQDGQSTRRAAATRRFLVDNSTLVR
ncbi:MAG TPA: Ig-like domain-containing protein [Thermoanaerobaculia bacterium]|nr:Ig-like domain-containing protein [Thermoanaerobaculia bacterium]